jgi:hypothetical protein
VVNFIDKAHVYDSLALPAFAFNVIQCVHELGNDFRKQIPQPHSPAWALAIDDDEGATRTNPQLVSDNLRSNRRPMLAAKSSILNVRPEEVSGSKFLDVPAAELLRSNN